MRPEEVRGPKQRDVEASQAARLCVHGEEMIRCWNLTALAGTLPEDEGRRCVKDQVSASALAPVSRTAAGMHGHGIDTGYRAIQGPGGGSQITRTQTQENLGRTP